MPPDLRTDLERAERELRRERVRARAGHWTYDLSRHLALSARCGRLRREIAEMEEAS